MSVKLPRVTFSFVWIIFLSGALALAAIIGNLLVLGLHRHPAEPHRYVLGADLERGRRAIVNYSCGNCHVIPGVRGANGRVGPSLENFSRQIYIAGILPNTPENLVLWLRDPQRLSPRTAMPDLDLSGQEARDIAGFLYRGGED